MAYLEKLLPEFRKGAKIRKKEWDKEVFIRFHEGEIYWYDDGAWKDGKIASTKDLVYLFTIHDNDWELYQEPIDWQYIIDHKCLCYFWDDGEDYLRIGLLTELSKSLSDGWNFDYLMNGRVWYEHCRPVRRDEVNFYGDKKDD